MASRRLRLLLPAALLALGLAATWHYGTRALTSFRQLQYIREQGLDRGSASVEAIRPWMTIRFVAVAYAVPEEYLYSELGIPFDQRNADSQLGRLNREYNFGPPPAEGGTLPIIPRVQAAVRAYQANPVQVGLRDVRPWMSIRYIANSSGVPEAYIFERIGVPQGGNQYKPLALLNDELHYEGGPRALEEAVERALAGYQGAP